MRALVTVFLLTVFCVSSFGADWPQWRGEYRCGVSGEKGLLKKWPDGGPKLLWTAEGIGEGHSSMSIADGTIYVTGNKGEKKNAIEYLSAFDLKGELKWQKPYGKPWRRSHPPARTTASIENGNAYVINGTGVISCFDIKDGNKKWTVDVSTKYDGQYGPWGIAESPLIVDDKVICTPGGKKATMVALDKKTGEVVWASKSIGDKPAYCSPIMVERGGIKVIVTILAKHIIGVNAADGEILWSYECSEYQPKVKGISTVTPLYHDGGIYVTSGYNMGSVKLNLSADGKSVKKAWFNMDLDVHVGGVVLVDGYIYGANWHNNRMGNWVCVDWKTGKTMYDTEWHCKGQIIAAEGMLYCYDEHKSKGGNFGLVKAGPKGFDVVSEFKIEKGKGVHWAHPAISDGVLYVRHENFLMAYDIKEN
jgi:outer membrane protein assembly factor BamB